MADGYNNAGENEFADLDEWLCEYVDGTIDPVVCKAFEEYMQQNPKLAMHVEQLRETRHLLCQYGCSYRAPSGLQPRLRRRLASEIIQESQPLLGGSAFPLMALATFTSVVAFLLIFAATAETTSSEIPPKPITEQSPPPKTLSPEQMQVTPNRRETPLSLLTSSKYYDRFTRPPAGYSPAYVSPSLYPLQAYAPPQTAELRSRPMEAFITP